MKIAVLTLGCKVNQYESDAIATKLRKEGHTIVFDFEPSDVYVINTCAVTKEAERKSRQAVARALKQNAQAYVFIIGCASQKNREQFENKKICYVSGVADKMAVVERIIKLSKGEFMQTFLVDGENKPLPSEYEEVGFVNSFRDRAYVKIEDGCNNFCSYCIIPYLRGRVRSRKLADIYKECGLLANTVNEIVLTGINTSAYGSDIGLSLTELVSSLYNIGARFRFSSLEVNVITDEFLKTLSETDNFCPHFHLSLQSGDDAVLKEMNRKYTTAVFKQKVQLIRSYFPMASITTDIIVGFCGEDAQSFAKTKAFVKDIGFSSIHIFPYSPRKGTVAYSKPSASEEDKNTRVGELAMLRDQLSAEYTSQFIYRELKVLIENFDGIFYEGYSENYIRVYIKSNEELIKGEIYRVTPNRLFKNGLLSD